MSKTSSPAGIVPGSKPYNPFGLLQDEPTTVLIDGSAIYYATRAASFDLDYFLLREYFKNFSNLRHVIYYSVLRIEEDGEGNEKHNALQPLLSFLSYNGFRTVTNEKFIREGSSSIVKMGNMLPHMATDILRHAEFSQHIVIFGGANDLSYSIEAARDRYGVKVSGASIIKMKGSQGHMGDDFRRACNSTVEMNDETFISAFEKKRDLPGFARA